MLLSLRWSGAAFALAFALHGGDHLRRGLDASPALVMVIGTVQGVFVAIAAWMAWTSRPGAAAAGTMVGFASALLVTFGHLLAATPAVLNDSFVSPPATNVTWMSWASAWGEIAAALAFAAVGAMALLRANRAH